MLNQNLQPRLLLLLLPLALISLVTLGLEPHPQLSWPPQPPAGLLPLTRSVIAGLFTLGAALLIPTYNRVLQLTAVLTNYLVLTLFCVRSLPELYAQPTVIVISVLSSTLLILPDYDHVAPNQKRPSLVRTGEIALVFLAPALFLGMIAVIIHGLNGFINLALTSSLANSPFSCIIAPIYGLLQALGFNSLINSLDSLRESTLYTHASLNSVLLTNLIALPVLLAARSVCSHDSSRTFLAFLALTTVLTSHTGLCVSLSLTILLLFFQYCFVTLMLSSVVIFFVCLHYQLPALSDFSTLYQPDLSFSHLRLTELAPPFYLTFIISALIPLALQLLVLPLCRFSQVHVRSGPAPIRIKLKRRSNPELYVIALLRAAGGLSNLHSVSREGRVLYLRINDRSRASVSRLAAICRRRPRYELSSNTYILDAGDNCALIAARLNALITEASRGSDRQVALSQKFIIR